MNPECPAVALHETDDAGNPVVRVDRSICATERALANIELAEMLKLIAYRERERDEARSEVERLEGLLRQEQDKVAPMHARAVQAENEGRVLRGSLRDERTQALDDAIAIVRKGGDVEAELEKAKAGKVPKDPNPKRPEH